MTKPAILKMDFDQWHSLASEDPQGFEQLRRSLLEEVISRAPQRRQRRLRGLQWRVDQVRSHAPNPMAACISLSSMMWDAFAGEHGLVDTLKGSGGSAGEGRSHSAEVIPYPVPGKD